MSGSAADRLRSLLGDEGLVAGAWSNGAGDHYPAHRHDYDKVLVAAEGSIEFALPELGQSVTLWPGDRLDLPAGSLHSATVGSQGVTCLEAHLQAGSLPAGLRRLAAWRAGPDRGRHVPAPATPGGPHETGPAGAA